MVAGKYLACLVIYFSWLGAYAQVYFTPRDDLKTYLIELIQQENVSIDAAVYMLTDSKIAQALVQAYVRGVKVRIIVDQISMGEKYGKGIFLKNNGLEVYVFNVEKKIIRTPCCDSFRFIPSPIMHHKFFIFGKNSKMQTGLLWTGSYNCTASASRLHQENVIILDDQSVINEYQQCFQLLLTRVQQLNF